MKYLVIACNIMKGELLRYEGNGISFIFLEQSLHRTPQKMKEVIKEEVDKANSWDGDFIILSYGLCSNGILGVKSERHSIVIPRVHDCIALFLGSWEKYVSEHQKEPGTYYLTKGWIDEGKSPLGIYHEYSERYGAETAEWAIKLELKNYTRIALVYDTGKLSEREQSRERIGILCFRERNT